MTTTAQRIADPAFWQQPLEARMHEFTAIGELERFPLVDFKNQLTGEIEQFRAVLRFGDVMDISRNPADFCSGQGSVSINDMPADAAEFFGSFITMDDPRHARLRNIVARSFTPRQLATVMDSVETIATEVIDSFCEQGEVDLVEVLSQPFPLLVICDMMGIPRSEFDTVLQATNAILGAGDPHYIGDVDPIEATLNAGFTLVGLMNEIVEDRRANPRDDITSQLVNGESGEELLTAEEIGPFFILLAVAGNDTTRNAISHGIELFSKNPEQRQIWMNDVAGVTTSGVEEIVRCASPVTFMRRTATRALTFGGQDFEHNDRLVMFYGAANRDPSEFSDPHTFDVQRTPNNHVGFGGPGPHFCLGAHLARREISVVMNQLFERLPDLEVTGPSVPLNGRANPPLVAGLKHLPVQFTPTAPLGA